MTRQPSATDDGVTDRLVQRAGRRTAPHVDDARGAFDELYALHARPLAAWLSSRVAPSDRDDVLNDIWTRIWEKLPAQFAGGNFRAWLFTVARNHLIDQSRRRNARRPFGYGGAAEDPDPAAGDPLGEEPWEILADEERGLLLRDCLEKLDDGRRRVFVGRLGGEDYAAIAEGLGISTAQAQNWLFAAKRLLRTCLGEGEA
jgi:RNA polymerase sigma-70 factor (ECF subfamily)